MRRRARRGRPYRPCREETAEEGGEIEAGLRIILRDADLEPRVCADPMLIGMAAQNLGRPRRQRSSTPLYRTRRGKMYQRAGVKLHHRGVPNALPEGFLLHDKQDEKRIASSANVPETSSVASPSVLPLPQSILRSAPAPLLNPKSMVTDVGPVELWATRWRRPSAAANPQGFCWSTDAAHALRQRVMLIRLVIGRAEENRPEQIR